MVPMMMLQVQQPQSCWLNIKIIMNAQSIYHIRIEEIGGLLSFSKQIDPAQVMAMFNLEMIEQNQSGEKIWLT
jgi:hypothetical protein